MPFPYYRRLSKKDKATYRKSDAIGAVNLPDAKRVWAFTNALEDELKSGDRTRVERAAYQLVLVLTKALRVLPVNVKVLVTRPRSAESELHGLYTRQANKVPVIQVWMRTSAHKRIVAFRTFLRTLLHEVCHHLDYELYRFADSFHTEGFFRRESSLTRQVIAPTRTRAPEDKPTLRETAATPNKRPNRQSSHAEQPPKNSPKKKPKPQQLLLPL